MLKPTWFRHDNSETQCKADSPCLYSAGHLELTQDRRAHLLDMDAGRPAPVRWRRRSPHSCARTGTFSPRCACGTLPRCPIPALLPVLEVSVCALECRG